PNRNISARPLGWEVILSGPAFDDFGGQIRYVLMTISVNYTENVRALESREGDCLACCKSQRLSLSQELQCDPASEVRVVGAIYPPISARTQQLFAPVASVMKEESHLSECRLGSCVVWA